MTDFKLGYCRDIAENSGGVYYSLNDLTVQGVSSIAQAEKDFLISSMV